jgi:hypothetical protein
MSETKSYNLKITVKENIIIHVVNNKRMVTVNKPKRLVDLKVTKTRNISNNSFKSK